MGRLLLLCFCLSLAAPAFAQWKTFTETRTVTAKNKPFACKYQVRYKGALTVDARKSKVTCKPDSKGKFGTVSETFVIGENSVEVVHDVKKGKDTIKNINIAKLTTPAPTTTTTTASPIPTPSPTGTGGGNGGGTGGGTGSGTGGGTGVTTGTGGEEMSCSCKLPLLDNSSESGRRLNKVASRVVERKKRSTKDLPVETRGNGHNHPSNSYSSGNALGGLVQVIVLASLAALAAYGKVTLLQNLSGLLGRSLNTDLEEQEAAQTRILSVLTNNFDRQGLGGLLGGLGEILGGAGGAVPNPSEQIEGLVEQAIQEQINEFLTGGGVQTWLASLLESEDMGQMIGEMVNTMIGNMDTENMVNTLSTQLGTDLGEMVSMLDEAMAGTDMAEVLSSLMGEMPEGQMESLLEGVNLNTMEMMMNCSCQKKN